MKILKIILILLVIALILFFPKLKRLYHTIHLFDEANIIENFRSFDKAFPSSTLTASPNPFIYPKGEKISLPTTFDFEGQSINTESFLKESSTTGLLVIQDDKLVFEAYYLGNTESTRNISWSVAKSFISTLMGIAVEEGHIKKITQKVEEYLPELKGTAYEGVRIKDVLQMSTGVKFDEDYGNFNSDINRWGRGFALGFAQDKFPLSLEREREPGTYNHYVSINTHVLGMILRKTTGQSITEYMQAKLWNPLGMEYDAYWILDNSGTEVALGGLNVTLRDYAKIGTLFLNEGKWQGKEIVPASWVKAATTPDAPHLEPGVGNPLSAHDFGYGYQWWVPVTTEGEYMARGIYNQAVYVNPTTRTVIVKLSANHRFNDKEFIPTKWESMLELFRTIAKK